MPARLAAASRRVAGSGVVVRKADFSRIATSWRRSIALHSAAWAENWGAVPLTQEEIRALARELLWFADRDLVFLAEYAGEPIGVAVTVPDLNQALGPARGTAVAVRLAAHSPAAAADRRRARAHPGRAQRLAAAAASMPPSTRARWRRRGASRYRWGEMSWILESNRPMIDALEGFGAERYKTYRIYDLELAAPSCTGLKPPTACSSPTRSGSRALVGIAGVGAR